MLQVSLSGDVPVGLHGGPLLAVALKRMTSSGVELSGEEASPVMQFYSWNGINKVCLLSAGIKQCLSCCPCMCQGILPDGPVCPAAVSCPYNAHPHSTADHLCTLFYSLALSFQSHLL